VGFSINVLIWDERGENFSIQKKSFSSFSFLLSEKSQAQAFIPNSGTFSRHKLLGQSTGRLHPPAVAALIYNSKSMHSVKCFVVFCVNIF